LAILKILQREFRKRYLHNSQRTKTNADNEAIHNAFCNGWLLRSYGSIEDKFL